MKKYLVAMLVLAGVSVGWAQEKEQEGMFGDSFSTGQWSVDFYTGYFSEAHWATMPTGVTYDLTINGITIERPIKAKIDMQDSWIFGGHFGKEWEYLGWEAGLAGVFGDLDVTTNLPNGFVANDQLYTSGDASMILTNFNLMVYPGGNNLMEGRLRPYLTAGPGLAYLMIDQKYLDDEFLVDMNAGLGTKIYPFDNDAVFMRVDWKWHYLFKGDEVRDTYHKELTIGVGFNF